LVKWHRRVLTFCFIIFAFEIGAFLLVFPWLSNWNLNWIPIHRPGWTDLWMSPYFRGALSGLGLLNIYVALAELVTQLKTIFAKRSE
jgi:hypothetical protein